MNLILASLNREDYIEHIPNDYLYSKRYLLKRAYDCVHEMNKIGYTSEEILNIVKNPFNNKNECELFSFYVDFYDYRNESLNETDKSLYKESLQLFLRYMVGCVLGNGSIN
jgi:hypothetical protein